MDWSRESLEARRRIAATAINTVERWACERLRFGSIQEVKSARSGCWSDVQAKGARRMRDGSGLSPS